MLFYALLKLEKASVILTHWGMWSSIMGLSEASVQMATSPYKEERKKTAGSVCICQRPTIIAFTPCSWLYIEKVRECPYIR